MQYDVSTHITFTPRAAAVRNAPAEGWNPPPPRFGTTAQLGDVVQLENCEAAFVVLHRYWSIGPAHETLSVMLDLLPPDERPLRVAT